MKIPKKINTSAALSKDGVTPSTTVFEAWEYPHSDPLLAEIAGHVFNQYLNVQSIKPYNQLGVVFKFDLGSNDPRKSRLFLSSVVTSNELMQVKEGGALKESIYQNAVEELLHKCFESVDVVHKLEHSLWARIKYVFTRKIK